MTRCRAAAVNNMVIVEQMRKYGVDGVITNYPGIVKIEADV